RSDGPNMLWSQLSDRGRDSMRTSHNRFIGGMQAFAAALQFLTRLPIRVQLNYNEDLFRRSTVYYPAAGALIGLLTAIAGFLLTYALPAAPASVLVLSVWIGLTGALHLDGLMDTADGLLSHRSRERMLEIMKDS